MTQNTTQQQRPSRPFHNRPGTQQVKQGPRATAAEIRESFKPQGSASTRRKNRSYRRLVENLFPKLFVNGYPLPMKNGIKDDMLTQIVRRGLDISEERLQAALRACCASLVYRTRQFTFRFRRDIDGQPVEIISKEDRQYAWKMLMEYRKRHKLPEIRPSWFQSPRKKGPKKGRPPARKAFKASQANKAG